MFWLASLVAIVATVMAITRLNATHALLYLIVSLLSVAVIFLQMGAPFVAAIEIIVYAGAILVLFIFVIMLLNLGPQAVQGERQLLPRRAWIGPGILVAILMAELLVPLTGGGWDPAGGEDLVTGGPIEPGEIPVVGPKEVGMKLFGPYLIGVELAGLLLLAGLIGAFHLGREETRPDDEPQSDDKTSTPEGPA